MAFNSRTKATLPSGFKRVESVWVHWMQLCCHHSHVYTIAPQLVHLIGVSCWELEVFAGVSKDRVIILLSISATDPCVSFCTSCCKQWSIENHGSFPRKPCIWFSSPPNFQMFESWPGDCRAAEKFSVKKQSFEPPSSHLCNKFLGFLQRCLQLLASS